MNKKDFAIAVEWELRRYTYNFTWLGRPIIQFPQDIVAIQELIWRVKPQVVVETGVAHGGSLVLSASILQLIGGPGEVIGVDVEIRPHNRTAIEAHSLAPRIKLVEGSSIDPRIVEQVHALVAKRPAMVFLDSNHSHRHVLGELLAYSSLVSKDSYLVVFDTMIEDMEPGCYPERPWDKGNSPKTAVWEFLKHNDRFVVDEEIENRLGVTSNPSGYLRCVKD